MLHVRGVVARRNQRQSVIDEKFHAVCGGGNSRSMTDAAANRGHSRISSVSRSEYSVMISRSERPPASNRSTVATGMGK